MISKKTKISKTIFNRHRMLIKDFQKPFFKRHLELKSLNRWANQWKNHSNDIFYITKSISKKDLKLIETAWSGYRKKKLSQNYSKEKRLQVLLIASSGSKNESVQKRQQQFDFPALSLLAKNSQRLKTLNKNNLFATFQSHHLKDETLK